MITALLENIAAHNAKAKPTLKDANALLAEVERDLSELEEMQGLADDEEEEEWD